MASLLLTVVLLVGADPLSSGDSFRQIEVDGRQRSYAVHVPPGYDPAKPTPVVLVFHGAGMNSALMRHFCGMNAKADESNFIVVYPNGKGVGIFFTLNAGGVGAWPGKSQVDDVEYTRKLLDDLAGVANVDPKRVFATGLSNGGMMCHRLAAELSDRIAAVAPVAGTLAIRDPKPQRPVPILHFHGTRDELVPITGIDKKSPQFVWFNSVPKTIDAWVKINGCPEVANVESLPDSVKDGTTVKRTTYGPGKDGAEVVLIEIEGGGHTWPGKRPPFEFLGKSTRDISANDLIWEFFERHPMK